MSFDHTAWADETAAKMRTYYDANRPLTFMEKLFDSDGDTAPFTADNLMIGLLNIALSAERERHASPTPSADVSSLIERLRHCTCADIEGENPDCDLHGVSVQIWASWTDEQCMMEPDIDSFTVRRKSQEAAIVLKRLTEAGNALVAKLDECEKPIADAAAFMWAHGIEYTGPQYGEALEALRAVLKAGA